MSKCKKLFTESNSNQDPDLRHVMDEGVVLARAAGSKYGGLVDNACAAVSHCHVCVGSSTAVLGFLHTSSGRAQILNLGDSGFMLVRNGAIVGLSKAQQTSFNCPRQLGFDPSPPHRTFDASARAELFNLQLQRGDLLALHTDGVLDNLFEPEIAKIMHDARQLPVCGWPARV